MSYDQCTIPHSGQWSVCSVHHIMPSKYPTNCCFNHISADNYLDNTNCLWRFRAYEARHEYSFSRKYLPHRNHLSGIPIWGYWREVCSMCLQCRCKRTGWVPFIYCVGSIRPAETSYYCWYRHCLPTGSSLNIFKAPRRSLFFLLVLIMRVGNHGGVTTVTPSHWIQPTCNLVATFSYGTGDSKSDVWILIHRSQSKRPGAVQTLLFPCLYYSTGVEITLYFHGSQQG